MVTEEFHMLAFKPHRVKTLKHVYMVARRTSLYFVSLGTCVVSAFLNGWNKLFFFNILGLASSLEDGRKQVKIKRNYGSSEF